VVIFGAQIFLRNGHETSENISHGNQHGRHDDACRLWWRRRRRRNSTPYWWTFADTYGHTNTQPVADLDTHRNAKPVSYSNSEP
jgi:hypothetical protein